MPENVRDIWQPEWWIHGLTFAVPPNTFALDLCLFGAGHNVSCRLRLQSTTPIVDAIVPKNRVHASLEGVPFPTE